MSIKSYKMRAVLILYALIKYSDKDHIFTNSKMNKFLKSYGLDYQKMILKPSMESFRQLGLKINESGYRRNHGYWLEDYPFNEDTVSALNIAISTNPYISTDEANNLLSLFTPFVPIYQEDLLLCNQNITDKSSVLEKCTVLHKAIVRNKEICFESLDNSSIKEFLYPNKIFSQNGSLYIEGTKPNNSSVSIKINDITNVEIIEI